MSREDDRGNIIGGPDRFGQRDIDPADQGALENDEPTETVVAGYVGRLRREDFLDVSDDSFEDAPNISSSRGTDFFRVRAGGVSFEALLARLHRYPFDISSFAQGLLQSVNPTMPAEPTDISFVCVSAGALGAQTEGEVYEQARKVGLQTCEPIDPYLCRRNYINQPADTLITVATPPIVTPSESEGVPTLRLKHAGTPESARLVLDIRAYVPAIPVRSDDRFIFRLPPPREATVK